MLFICRRFVRFLAVIFFAAPHSDPASGGDRAEAREDINRPAQSARSMGVLAAPREGENC